MMRAQVFLLLQLALALAVMYSGFCRLTKTNADTHREIRWAFLFETMCAGIVAGAPFLPLLMPHEARWTPGTTPTWAWLLLLLSVWLVQVVTSRYWHEGCPTAFQRTHTEPSRSRFVSWLAAPLALTLLAVFVSAPTMAVASASKDPAQEWEPIKGDVVLLERGTTFRCALESGCILARPDTLRELMQDALEACRAPGSAPKRPSAL